MARVIAHAIARFKARLKAPVIAGFSAPCIAAAKATGQAASGSSPRRQNCGCGACPIPYLVVTGLGRGIALSGPTGHVRTFSAEMTSRKSRIPRPGVVGGYSLPETLRLYPGEYPRPSGCASLRGYHSASGKASLRESDPGTGRDTLPVSQWGSGWGPLPGSVPESPGEPGGAPLRESGTLSGPASRPASGRSSGPVRGSWEVSSNVVEKGRAVSTILCDCRTGR